MTSTFKIACRLHPRTGRLSCRVITSIRNPAPAAAADTAAGRSHHEAVRRARRRVNELVHDYDLRLMWTLTYAVAPSGYNDVAASLPGFTRRLRRAGLLLPRLTVPEQDSTGRWHLHLAVPDYLPHSLLEQLWRHGGVGVPNFEHASAPDALQRLSDYLTKGFDTTPLGCRRYIPSAGMRPQDLRFTAPTETEALKIASSRMGGDPHRTARYAGNLLAFFNAQQG